MHPSIRQQHILELLDELGELTVQEVCRRFSLSPATVRRDFSRLAARGRVLKFWGGISSATSAGYAPDEMLPSFLRNTKNPEAKEAIAREAASMVADGDVVAVDGGTTTLRLARYLANRPVRIVTNSILIAHRIESLRGGAGGAEVFLTGGLVYPSSGLLVGPQAVANLQQYHSNWAFLSAGGLDAGGVTNTNQLVVESERAIIKNSRHAVLLADRTKWECRDMVRLCSWEEIDILVTDGKPEIPLEGPTVVVVRGTED